jgi:hypothetical protein
VETLVGIFARDDIAAMIDLAEQFIELPQVFVPDARCGKCASLAFDRPPRFEQLERLGGDMPPGLNPNALLAGLAPWTYNATAYYENKLFQLRLSFVHRDETLAAVCPCDNVPGDRYNVATNYLDAQLSFPLPFYRKASITLQAQNLMQQVTLSRFDKQEARPYNGSYAGRNFVIGLRANF